MILTPWFKSPFTDLTGAVVSHQWYGRCAKLELKLLDCLEAYGLERGTVKCDDLIQDFRECTNREKQCKRAYAMRKERFRQYSAGERTKENLYAPSPEADSW